MLRPIWVYLTARLIRFSAILLLIIAILSAWFIYQAALPGQFLFDDPIGLEPLAKVHDFVSAIGFLGSGHAGPLGRPIAMATFLPQREAWPDHPDAMLAVNFAIHLAAMAAAFILAVGLARLRLPETRLETRSLWIGLGVAALWGLSPFLATTHLMVIQRVTSVSGFFVLFGLSAFVWAHLIAPRHPRRPILLLVLGLGLGTLLAALSKENGALLPLLALVIFWFWIPSARRPRTLPYRLALILFAVIPGLLVLGYLANLVPGALEHGYGAHRYFTPEQRLMIQPSILMDYLRNLLLPRAAGVTPFMDHLPAPSGWLNPPITLVGLLFWLGLLALAIGLRHRLPVLLFGLSFFLIGHLLESSIIGLELYFAHRNYVPSFGIYFALIFATAMVPDTYRKAAVSVMTIYVGLFALVLWQATSTWSQPGFAAERWVAESPYSERAVEFLARQAMRQGDYARARQLFDDAAARYPDRPVIQIQRTQICKGREDQFPQLLDEVATHLKTARLEPFTASLLAMAAQGDPMQLCSKRDHAALAVIADALLENPPYIRNRLSHGHLLFTKAMASFHANDMTRAIELLMESFRAYPHLDTAFYAASLMTNLDQDDRVQAFLAEVRQQAPSNLLQRAAWLARLDDFVDFVAKARQARKIEGAQPIDEKP